MHQNWFENMSERPVYSILESFMKDSEVQDFLQINRYKDALWFNRETSELLLKWMSFTATVKLFAGKQAADQDLDLSLRRLFEIVKIIQTAAAKSSYQVEVFIELLKEHGRTTLAKTAADRD
jgi:glucuronate isomerase